ncbi:MAG: radical SAM protein [Candidatus Methanofastidiosia archaeon]|jgi:radical SAM protein with 4Fe4S-binding SPASM domain
MNTPKIVGWEVTRKCNLQCRHCGSAAGPETARSSELTLKESIKVAEQLIDLGSKRIALSGGEPFMCNHWEPLARFISEQGAEVQFVSNGVLIDDNVAKTLQEFPGRATVGLSLDGAVPETHEYIRNCPGLYKKVFEDIDILKEHNIPVAVITTVHEDNFSELHDLYKILYNSGIYAWQVQMAMPIGRMANQREKILTGEKALELARFIVSIREKSVFRIETAENLGYYNSLEAKLRSSPWTGCSAGIRVLGIRSNGDVIGCLSLIDTEPEGNVREQSIADIWEDPDNFSYNRKFKISDLKGPCKDCKYGFVCRGGCSFLCRSLTGEYHNNPLCLRLVDKDSDSVVLVG